MKGRCVELESQKATLRMTKKPKGPAYEAALEHLFTVLDAAPVGADQPILRKASDTHSINTLMKMAKKEQKGAVLTVVKSHQDWLNGLKDYRDEIIHRLVVQAPIAGWSISHKGKPSKAALPVVVPRMTPRFAPDTRRSRQIEEEVPIGLMKSESTATVTFQTGAETVLEHKISYQPTDDYVTIQAFMAEHLAAYDAFLADMFQALTTTNFQQSKA